MTIGLSFAMNSANRLTTTIVAMVHRLMYARRLALKLAQRLRVSGDAHVRRGVSTTT